MQVFLLYRINTQSRPQTIFIGNENYSGTLNCPGINLAIILGYDSSPTRYKQRKGRAIRKEGDKIAELFTLCLNNTVETSWFEKSHGDSKAIVIDAENLMKVLRHEDYETYKKPTAKFTFRF